MSAALERWGGRTALVLVAAFALWFTVSEWAGVQRFIAWFAAGVGALPSSLHTVATYYTITPFGQLLPSLVIGAVVGGLIYVLGVRRARTGYMLPLQVGVGAVLGVISGQLFGYITQHCTYAPDAGVGVGIAGLVLTGLVAAALPALVANLTRLRSPDLSSAGYFKSPVLPYLLLVPTLLSLLLFLYYPSVQTVALSLTSRRFPLPQERFVCLTNYVTLAGDTIYQNAFVTTLLLTVLIVLFSLAISLSIALLASQKLRGAAIYRTLLIWPFALSPVVAGTVFLAMFREGGGGLVNFFTGTLFGIEPSWLRDASLARFVVVLASVWNILGFNILFYIAGLQNVPKDLLESAAIDGANVIQRFWRITFPLLAPFTFFLLVTNVTYSFYGVYGAVDTLTQGGPPMGPAGNLGGATDVLIYKLYEDAFNPGSPAGLAAAQALVLFVLVAGITLLQFRYVEQRITYSE